MEIKNYCNICGAACGPAFVCISCKIKHGDQVEWNVKDQMHLRMKREEQLLGRKCINCGSRFYPRNEFEIYCNKCNE